MAYKRLGGRISKHYSQNNWQDIPNDDELHKILENTSDLILISFISRSLDNYACKSLGK